MSVAVLRDRVRTLEEANRRLEGEDLCRAHHAVASLERENLFLRELLEPFLQLDEAVVGRQEVRRGLGCGGRSSQCWRFGEHWVVAVVGRQEVRRGRLERRLEHGESVDPVKTATRMPCCVVWLVKRFLQWSANRPRDYCALRGGR